MEGYSQQVLPTLLKNHDFLAGDAPEFLAAGESGNEHEDSSLSSEEEISDCESSVSGSSTISSSSSSAAAASCRRREGALVELSQGERIHEVIRQRFLSCLNTIGGDTTVVSIRRKNWLGISAQAKLRSFQIHSRALADKNGGNPNVKFAWYGNRRERIQEIISHGFSFTELQNNNGAVFLSPDDSPALSLEDSIPDENGVRHMLLCRVILGQPEVVWPGLGQTHPSSDEVDSGVDGLQDPKKYIVWSTNMNTHILPEYVVSFRAPAASSSRGEPRILETGMKTKVPTSPWISFPGLISALSKFLPKNALSLIYKYHKDYKEKRISRLELIHKVRQIAGDKLLISVIKSSRGDKELRTSLDFFRNRNGNK